MQITARQEIIVWLTTCRSSKKLRRLGTVVYVSCKMNYAIMYLTAQHSQTLMAKINDLPFVKRVELSPRQTLKTDYSTADATAIKLKRNEELCE